MAVSALFLSSLVLLLFLSSSNAQSFKACNFDGIYQLGDSTSDTGNLIIQNSKTPFSHFPYGETSFKNATGRCSNGLLMIDYFASEAGLPFLEPYLKEGIFTRHGVNFAVAGSTALPYYVLAEKNISSPITNTSLNDQLDWMFSHFNSICFDDKDCARKLKNALFIVGEIGGNDYNFALFQGKTIQEVKNMVPDVVRNIKDAIEKVISFGATRIIVPGHFPIGCLPIYLTKFQTKDSTAYDELHCLKDLNNLATYHNSEVQKAIEASRKANPHVIITYGDYYNAFLWVSHKASSLGFDEASIQKSCCGIGGDYNFNPLKMCGDSKVPVCSNPAKYVSWDGIRLTQEAYRQMTYWLIHDLFSKLQCKV